MKKTILALAVASTAVVSIPSMAYTAGQPSSTAGVSVQQFDASGADIETFGLFYKHSDKMFATEGFIHDFRAELTKGDERGVDLDTYDFSAGTGYRFGLERDTFFDLVGGVGFERLNLESDDDYEYNIPYLNLGVGLSKHFNSDNSGRIELGTRYSFSAETETDDYENDIDNKGNLYAEATWANSSSGVPLEFSVYHRKNDLNIQNQANIDSDVTGLKAGFRF